MMMLRLYRRDGKDEVHSYVNPDQIGIIEHVKGKSLKLCLGSGEKISLSGAEADWAMKELERHLKLSPCDLSQLPVEEPDDTRRTPANS